MILINARSIRNKQLEFRCLVADEKPDIIGITESWIQTEVRDFEGEFELTGYSLFRKDRPTRKGGGVLLYVRSYLGPTCRTIDSHHEVIGVDITGSTKTIHILLVYRTAQIVAEDVSLYELLTRLIHNKITVIAGDFNCGNVDWRNRTTVEAVGARLVDFANDNFLEQLVRVPTRRERTLDLIFSTEEDLVNQVSVGECLGTSDHNMVRCLIELPTHSAVPDTRRRLNLRLANYEKFKTDLGDLQPQRMETIEATWTNFKTRFMAIQASCIPFKKVGGSRVVKPKWFTRGIAEAITQRKIAYNLVQSNPTPEGTQRLTGLRRQVKRLVRRAKHDEELRVAAACKQNPKEFFSYVNSRKPIRANIGPLTSDQGNLITSNEGIAGVLNDYFASVFTEESDDAIPEPEIRYRGMQPLEDIQCTSGEITDKIKTLKANKSAGPDGFLPGVIKAVSEMIVPHLLEVFNHSLGVGAVPDDMKIAEVAPIHKKGPRDIPGNYRPISLTSVVGKLMESVIADRIVEHLETNNLLGNSQHGFRRKRSCLTNLLEFFHHMITVYDTSKAIDVLYLDFRKAFDKVPHKRLMAKVRALGIGGRVANWIEHWLADRQQRVVINGGKSPWSPVKSGVPQGSVLGPLLFLIYINDLDQGIFSKICKFADDTKLGANAANSADIALLQQDLIRIGRWSDVWQMPFNADKCTVMHIGSANQLANYTLQGGQIPTTHLEKDLGVYISDDLKFSKQCTEVEKKAGKILGYISRQFKYRDKVIVLSLYNALVRPLLEYAVQFWSPTLVKDIERLEKIQARATKLIPSIRNKGYQRRLEDLDLFTLEKRRLRGQLIETFKILNGFNNIDHRNLFTLSETSNRSNGKLQLKRFRTRPCGDFMTYRICNVWNRLPCEVTRSGTVETFKRRLDRILHNLDY